MAKAAVHRFEVEIVSTLDADLIERAVRAASNSIVHYLRMMEHDDPAIRVRVNQLARRTVFDVKSDLPSRRPGDAGL